MHRVIVLVLAVACGGGSSGPDPHELATCESGAWVLDGEEITQCELGCVEGPMQGVDADGDGLDDRCPTARCPVAFMVDGVALGCCLPEVGNSIPDSIERFKAFK